MKPLLKNDAYNESFGLLKSMKFSGFQIKELTQQTTNKNQIQEDEPEKPPVLWSPIQLHQLGTEICGNSFPSQTNVCGNLHCSQVRLECP